MKTKHYLFIVAGVVLLAAIVSGNGIWVFFALWMSAPIAVIYAVALFAAAIVRRLER